MRPVSEQNSCLRNPLDEILGYPGNIQLLRVLFKTRRGMGTSEIAKRTGLSVPGTHKVISRLLESGVIQNEPTGRVSRVSIRKDHPIARDLADLFESEKDLFSSFLEELKKAINKLDVKPIAAWIYGKLAEGVDEYGDPVKIALLADAKQVDQITENFRNHLHEADIEKKYDVTLEVRGITLADFKFLNVNYSIQLYGLESVFYAEGPYDRKVNNKDRDHSYFDRQSLKNSKYWAEFIKRHPEVVPRAINRIEQQLDDEPSGVGKELEEWKRILESMSYQRLKKFLESDSERSTRLRQSLPFWPVLTEAEREEFKSLVEEP